MQLKHFHLDKIKIYLDGVLAKEHKFKTYSACADNVYALMPSIEWVTVRDVECWLKGRKIKVETNLDKISQMAKTFAVDMSSLTEGKARTAMDVYWWALATAIWVYGGMNNINPYYKGRLK